MRIAADILNSFTAVNESVIDALLEKEIIENDQKIVVLDDDPTGVQTVHDVSVYTDWSKESIRKGFAEKNKVFYILTNSRGLTAFHSERIHREIAAAISEVSKETGKDYMIMSRSDSTLRGHYPLETMVLKEEMEKDGYVIDGEVLCPFFKEGGRFTIDDIHYVRQGNELVPAAETEFAKDRTFGYTQSSLPAYIEEKTQASFKAGSVTCVSLSDLRAQNYEKITSQLTEVKDFNKIIVNAADYCDIKVFSTALYRAMKAGRHYIFRTAAGLVKVMGGITDRPLLTKADMVTLKGSYGGIVIVGSHTEKTTAQLYELLKSENTIPVAFNSDLVLEGEDALFKEAERCVKEEEKIIQSGKTAVVYTKRKLLEVENDTKESALLRSVKISEGVSSLIAHLSVTPAFIIAKGGITSSEIGTKALGVRRADVLGQIQPGIPVWKTGEESRFPGTPYVIFPGNVGDEMTLRKAVEILSE